MKEITILLVEDDYLNRRSIKKALTDYGYKIFESKDSKEAISVLETEKINLIILDINLGKEQLEGISLGQYIKEKYGIPFIYLTAYETGDIVNKAVVTKPLSYLTKPFKNVDLIVSVEIAIQKIYGKDEDTAILVVKDDEYNVRIPIDQIDYIESEGNYLHINVNHKTYKYRSTIKQILDILPSQTFIQTHRAFVVNKNKIDMFSAKSLIIKNAAIPISKNYISGVQAVYELPDKL